MAYGYRNLTPKMEETLRIMIKHRKLIHYDGGFWSWEGCKMEHGINFDCPMWYCLVNTLRALHKKCRKKAQKKYADIGEDALVLASRIRADKGKK